LNAGLARSTISHEVRRTLLPTVTAAIAAAITAAADGAIRVDRNYLAFRVR
jgi:hypothetical protein